MRKTVCRIVALQMMIGICFSAGQSAEAFAQTKEECVPYLLRVTRRDISIFEDPGYDYSKSTAICDPGMYTIVDEQMDSEGILWGKLKSGAGWIDLAAANDVEDTKPITAVYADDVFLEEYESYEFLEDRSDYMVKLAFFPEEEWTDVWFGSLEFVNGNYVETEKICSFPGLSTEEVLIMGVQFYGDLTTYSIVFTDEAGWRRHFAVSMSGRDGSLVLEEYWT